MSEPSCGWCLRAPNNVWLLLFALFMILINCGHWILKHQDPPGVDPVCRSPLPKIPRLDVRDLNPRGSFPKHKLLVNLDDLDNVANGGSYSPASCGRTPSTRSAILIPYRNRSENLRIFLGYMHPFLQRQDVEYKIYVISQVRSLKNILTLVH